MKLTEYIQSLQGLLEEHGDIERLYTSIDDEGNGYNEIEWAPECRFLSPHEEDYRPENLIQMQGEESLEAWLDNNCIDEEDIPNLKKVILL